MKNFILSAVAILVCCMLAVSAAAAKAKHAVHKAAPVKTATADDVTSDLYTKRGATGVLALENLHENGSTCLTCSNGIYGTSGTHNMRSNEF